jgi:hypothetical protein
VALAQAEDIELAQQAAAAIDNPQRRSEALAQIAMALAHAGEIELARQAAEQARQAAGEVGVLHERAAALARAAGAFTSVGGPEHLTDTVRILRDVLEIEDVAAQRMFFRKACLANLALFPVELSPLVVRFLVPRPNHAAVDR